MAGLIVEATDTEPDDHFFQKQFLPKSFRWYQFHSQEMTAHMNPDSNAPADMTPQDEDATAQVIGTVNDMLSGFFAILPKAGLAILVFMLVIGLAFLVQRLVTNAVTRTANQGVGLALGRLASVAMIFAGLLVSIAIVAPSVGAAELLQVLGVGSVAIGFAFRDVLQNFLAGIIILLRQPFKEGDIVEVSGFSGVVGTISTRSTWLKTFDGQHVSIPNGEIFQNPVKIMTKTPDRRNDFTVTIDPDADPAEAIRIARGTVAELETVFSDPAPDAGIKDFSDIGNVIEVRFWTTVSDGFTTRREAMLKVSQALRKAGIDIARLPRPVSAATAHHETDDD